jgi:TetR/AcrR family transcriptional regulator, regulator of mycofactocin system
MTEVAAASLSAELRAKRSQMMVSELEAVALRLFEERGFDDVSVDDIASEARISGRTFYRYFAAKESVLQVRIDQRTDALRVALSARPADEAPLRALRLALEEAVSTEDMTQRKRWIAVIVTTPSVVNGVIGGIQFKTQQVIAEFLGSRLQLPSDGLVPTMLAAATGGVIQAAHTQWFVHGGDLAQTISEGLEVLERGIGSDPIAWVRGSETFNRAGHPRTRSRAKR